MVIIARKEATVSKCTAPACCTREIIEGAICVPWGFLLEDRARTADIECGTQQPISVQYLFDACVPVAQAIRAEWPVWRVRMSDAYVNP